MVPTTGVVRHAMTVFAIALAYPGCSAPSRLPAVPKDLTTEAEVPGIPGARYMLKDLEPLIEAVTLAASREDERLAREGHTGLVPPSNLLGISGGGDNGAFAAGILSGWTETGTRPEFNVVTGISTGSLIAPFAFLGPDYDETISSIYTSIGPGDIYSLRGSLSAMLFDDALADTTPLLNLITKHIDEAFMERVAEEWKRGRWLLIGTANLDARQGVIWNMGVIAESGHPESLNLFRRVMLASAALPGFFPPVMIDVEVDGEPYQEMHVDGGAVAQVFLYPAALVTAVRERGLVASRQNRKKFAYLIRNSPVDPDWASVERRTFSILGRSVTSLFHTQGIGDLYRLYLVGKRDKVDYNLAIIGPEFKVERKEEFDTDYMKALYDYGYQLARKGYPWRKTPPGFTE